MNKINLYIFLMSIRFILFNILIITILFSLINLLEISRLIAHQDSSLTIFLLLSLLKIPSIISQIIPFVIIISIAFIFRNLISNNELISMRNVGLSIIDIYKPIALSIFIFGLLILTLINPISAKFENRFNSLTSSNIVKNYSIKITNGEMWIKNLSDKNEKRYININNLNFKNMHAKNIKILSIDEENDSNKLIISKEGAIKDKLFKLIDVKIINIKKNKITYLDEYNMNINFNRSNLLDSISNYKFIPFYKYYEHTKTLKKFNLHSSEISLYYLSELLRPFFLIIIGFVVMSYSGKFKRNENFFKILFISILIGFLFFLLKEIMISLTTKMNLSFIFSYLIVFSLPIFIGLYNTMKIEND